jgi:MFS family permease
VRWLSSTIRKMIIFRNRSFGLLWGSQVLSNGGNWLLEVAVPVYVFHLTGSARDTGLIVVAEILPSLLFGPVGGVFADRWSRRRLMIGTNVLAAGAVAVLPLARHPSQLWLVLAAVFAESCLGAFFSPAYQGLVPALVGRDGDLATANAWSAAAGGAIGLTCAPLGAVLYALGGLRLPVAVDAATYLAAALLVALIPAGPAASARPSGDERPARPSGDAGPTMAGPAMPGPAMPGPAMPAPAMPGPAMPGPAMPAPAMPAPARLRAVATTDLRGGVAALRRDRVLTTLLTTSALFLLGNGACSALLVPYVVGSLHARAASIGELFSALELGYLLSTYIGRRACASPRLRASVLALIGILVVAFAGLFDVHSFGLAFVFIGLMGIGGGAFLTLEKTITQRRAADDLIGRISAAYSAVVTAATFAGALLASLAVAWFGRATALNLAIAVIAVAAVPATRLPARVATARPAEQQVAAHVRHATSGA